MCAICFFRFDLSILAPLTSLVPNFRDACNDKRTTDCSRRSFTWDASEETPPLRRRLPAHNKVAKWSRVTLGEAVYAISP